MAKVNMEQKVLGVLVEGGDIGKTPLKAQGQGRCISWRGEGTLIT